MSRVSDADILAFVQANIDNPALIAETAAQYGVSVDDLSRATGYDSNAVVSYFQQADVAPPAYEPPPTGGLSAVSVAEEPTPPPPPDEPVYEPPPQIYEPPPDPEEPIYEPPRPPEKPVVETPRPPVIVERPEPPPPPPPVDVRPPPPPPIEEVEERPRPPIEEKPPTPPRPPTREIVEPPPRPDGPPTKTIYEPKIVDLGDGTFRTPGGTIIDKDGYPVTTPVDTAPTAVVTPPKTYTQTEVNDALTNLLANDPNAKRSDVAALAATLGITADQVNAAYSSLPANKPAAVETAVVDTSTTKPVTKAVDTPAAKLPTLTDHQGNQYDGAQLLTLAQQIAQNAGSMTGGAFQTKGENIGFAATEANTLLGRTATASEQVLLDMARQFIQSGVTDLSQLKTQDITSSGVSVQLDPETNQYYALIPSADGETSTRKELTPDQVAKIKTQEVLTGGEGETSTYRTIDDLVTGKGLFANGKLLTAQDAVDNPIAYTIGSTYTGGGGTSYDLKFDPKTGKSVVSANGFTTSDADTIMPIIMIASNFLLPGVGSMLTSTLVEAGMSEIVSQVVSKSIINGVTSGIMAEASGGDFGDGFLKGSITGAISAGVAPMISTALPSDLSPAISSALTKAGTAAITALATGTDVGTAIGTQLLNSAVGTGLSSVTGEMGLSTADAKLLNSVLTPVVTQLVTNGNVNDATLMNAVLLAGSTILANVDSPSVSNVSTLTTGSDTDKVVGGLNLLATETGNETLTDLASTVGTGLGAVSTATGLLNKVTSLTSTPKIKVNKTRANLTGALTTTGKPITRTAAVKPAALNTINKPKTTTTAVKPAALGALNTAKKTLTAQQISQLKASKPAAQVNVANLTPIKKATPPQKVDVKTLIPVKTAQLPAGLNTKKMG
jgi:hypothetical protein